MILLLKVLAGNNRILKDPLFSYFYLFFAYFIDYTKAFQCVDHNKLGKFLQRWEYHTTLPASWESCMQIKKQQLELDTEQWTGSKLWKEYKAVYCHPV